jgi:hypothetical protein
MPPRAEDLRRPGPARPGQITEDQATAELDGIVADTSAAAARGPFGHDGRATG